MWELKLLLDLPPLWRFANPLLLLLHLHRPITKVRLEKSFFTSLSLDDCSVLVFNWEREGGRAGREEERRGRGKQEPDLDD